MGAGAGLALTSCALAVPPTARMLFKCACDMILILERSFRYQGKYVSIKQIEDAAVYYTTAMTTTFAGKEVLLQQHVHDEVDRLIPLSKFSAAFKFSKLRPGLEDIIYKNRFQKVESEKEDENKPMVPEIGGSQIAELDATQSPIELHSPQTRHPVELPAEVDLPSATATPSVEKEAVFTGNGSTTGTSTTADDLLSMDRQTTISQTPTDTSSGFTSPTRQLTLPIPETKEIGVERSKSEGMFSRTRRFTSKLGLRKSKTIQE